jgi:type III restriction enzyme
MNAAKLKSEQFSADQLVLTPARDVDPTVFDVDAYDDFMEANTGGRPYHREAATAVLNYLCGQRYQDAADLASQAWDNSEDLQRRYATADQLVARLPFADKLSCSVDLATGTGKSFLLYRIARVMLNEGLVDRVLVLCPSLTIEAGLREKFTDLTADTELLDMLPERDGIPVPNIVDAGSTIQVGDICIENVHATFERTGSSIRDSFAGAGANTLVLSDEAHHIYSPVGKDFKRWYEFIADPVFSFRYHVGVSGTCYVGNDYFTDVVYRYGIRDAINDGWVKEVFYLAEDDSSTDDEVFQKLRAQHEKNRKTYGVKPLTIAVTKNIKDAKQLGEDLTAFLSERLGDADKARAQVLVVSSAAEHEKNVEKLRLVDDASSLVEWVCSVSMLSEGWDVANVLQIYPHEKRAFNSKLLISQVLGRGLRLLPGYDGQPAVYVFNHARWGPQVYDLVADVLDVETTISQRPVTERPAPHFDVHLIEYAINPTSVEQEELEKPKLVQNLNLHPQVDAEEDTQFVSATDVSRSAVLTTAVVNRRYALDEVVRDVRAHLLEYDKRTSGELAKLYPRTRVRKLIADALKRLDDKSGEVTQENRQLILSAFGSMRQRRTRKGAALETKPSGLRTTSTADMSPIHGRISDLTSHLAVYYDGRSEDLGTSEDKAALRKAEDIDVPTFLTQVPNEFYFKSPVNLVIANYKPERRFVQELMRKENAAALTSWVKAPDVGWYTIEYAYQRGGVGRSKRGGFNPDFFLLAENTETIVVVEVKMDDDVTDANRGKLKFALAHFATINKMLTAEKSKRRYAFHFISPQDYSRFFAALRDGKLGGFTSTLHAALLA